MTELSEILREIAATPHTARVLATLVTVAGSSYRRPGARLLLGLDGSRIGSISGGCLEEDVLARARRVALTGAAERVTYDTTSENDLVWGVGLGCHGVVQVLIEKLPASPSWAAALAVNLQARCPTPLAVVWQAHAPEALGTRLALADETASTAGVFVDVIHPPVRLVIFGAGDDAQPLVRIAQELGWHVTVADPRADFASGKRFPTANALIVGPAEELVQRVAPSPDTLAVVMTHRYVHDLPVLRQLLPCSLPYVGLLGPRARADRLLADLAKENVVVTGEQRARFHAPVGLDLGAENPAEVALSIVAEIRASLGHRDARPLRERTRPIHA